MTYLASEDRVLESTTTTGTGALTLAGAVTGFRRFSEVCAVGDTLPYFIEALDSLGVPTGDYEYGTGTYSGVNTLTRTTVIGSSNAGAAVNFAAGTKNVGFTIHKTGLNTLADARVANAFTAAGLQSVAASGYQKLPGGLILQWGTGTTSVTPGTGTTVTFPIAFPGACFSLTGGNKTSNSSGLFLGVITTANFTAAANAATVNFSWMAIGN